MANHQHNWFSLIKIAALEDREEKEKYKHYDKIKEAGEQSIYAPKGPRYTSGKGIKRTFRNLM